MEVVRNSTQLPVAQYSVMTPGQVLFFTRKNIGGAIKRESGGTVRLACFKFGAARVYNTHTVETTMPRGLHGNLTHF